MARATSLDMTAIHSACRFLAEEGFPAAARALAEKFTQGPDQCPTCYVRHVATEDTPECEACRPSWRPMLAPGDALVSGYGAVRRLREYAAERRRAATRGMPPERAECEASALEGAAIGLLGFFGLAEEDA